MNTPPKTPTALLRLMLGVAAIAAVTSRPLLADDSAAPATQSNSASAASSEKEVVLDPFTVTTSKDNGYAATNAISGSIFG